MLLYVMLLIVYKNKLMLYPFCSKMLLSIDGAEHRVSCVFFVSLQKNEVTGA